MISNNKFLIEGSKTLYFLTASLRCWNTWTFFVLASVCTMALSSEKNDGNVKTRLTYTLKLNVPHYIYTLASSIFCPITFKGDGRFYTFILSANSLFILFFLTMLNPFYVRSTHFPQLEEMTGKKVLLFSIIEFTIYEFCAILHLAWTFYLVDYNV